MNNLVRYANSDPFFGIFDDFFRTTPVRTSALTTNRQVRVENFDDHTEISIAAPGLKQSSFNVDLTNNTLTVGYQAEEGDDTYFTKNSYSRYWRVADGTTAEDITANYTHGILTVTVKKAETTTNKTSIPVN